MVLLSMHEISLWLNLSAFEIWLHAVGILLSTVLLALKQDFQFTSVLSYWVVMCPLLVAAGLNLYLVAIVFIRQYLEERTMKAATQRALNALLAVSLLAAFEALLCNKLTHPAAMHSWSYAIVFAPLSIQMCIMGARACQLTGG